MIMNCRVMRIWSQRRSRQKREVYAMSILQIVILLILSMAFLTIPLSCIPLSLQAAKEKENAARKREEKEEQLLVDGVSEFRRWIAGHQYPRLGRKDAFAIVRVLLPHLDIKGEMKLKDFSTAKACIKWLGEIGRGTTWDEEMKVLDKKLKNDG